MTDLLGLHQLLLTEKYASLLQLKLKALFALLAYFRQTKNRDELGAG